MAAGAILPPEIRVEIHPSWGLDAKQVKEQFEPGFEFVADTYLR